MSEKQYNLTFGCLSAFGIIFVVLGHVGANTLTFDGWFTYYSFHMPLFIFISGYFFDINKIESVPKYLLGKVKRLLIPFYVWNLVYLLIQTVLRSAWGYQIGNSFSWHNLLVYPWTNDQPYGFNIASWFLIALFIVEVLNALISWGLKKIKLNIVWIKLIIYIILCLIGISNIQNGVTGFVKIINRSLYLMLFFQVGNCYRCFAEKWLEKINGTIYFLFLFGLQFYYLFEYGSLDSGVYGGVDFEFTSVVTIVPIIGILFWLRIAKMLSPLLSKVKWFVFLGKNTMSVMMHHLFAIFIFQTGLYWIQQNSSRFSSFDGVGYKSRIYYLYVPHEGVRLVYAIVSIAMVLGVLYVSEKLKKKIIEQKGRKSTSFG